MGITGTFVRKKEEKFLSTLCTAADKVDHSHRITIDRVLHPSRIRYGYDSDPNGIIMACSFFLLSCATRLWSTKLTESCIVDAIPVSMKAESNSKPQLFLFDSKKQCYRNLCNNCELQIQPYL